MAVQPAQFQIRGATALVTGAARRLGRAIALGLAQRGANVVAHFFRSEAEAARVVEEARATGVRAWSVQADLGDPDEAKALTGRVIDLAGPVSILVNNASIWLRKSSHEETLCQTTEQLQVNATSPRRLMEDVAAQGIPASVVNMLDARIADHDNAAGGYLLSKQRLYAHTLECAVAMAPRVRVNAVAPGLILPPQGEGDEYIERLTHTNLLGRAGTVDEVVAAVLFLLEAGFTTGQVVFVDGGRHLKGPSDARRL